MADDQPQAAAGDAQIVHIKITGPAGANYAAAIRKLGNPPPDDLTAGKTWTYDLPSGSKWIWTVNITGVAGVAGSFTISGATKAGAAKFTIPGDKGVPSGTVLDVSITV